MEKIKIGDEIRFLNSTGGGKVVRIDNKTQLVYVEDQDGFEIPTLAQECVVVNSIKENGFPQAENTKEQTETEQIHLKPQTIHIIETPEGEQLKPVLAFVPQNIKILQSTAYDCYLVNDCNYMLYYNLISMAGEKGRSLAHGMIEPNMQECICMVSKDELNDWERIRVQIIPMKEDKLYNVQSVIDMEMRLPVVKFYKLHSFTDSEYFDTPALTYDLYEESTKEKLTHIRPEQIKEALLSKEVEDNKKRPVRKKQDDKGGILEVDLHIHQLLDNTTGMSNGEMLRHQMDVFHQTLAEHKHEKGRKIVFIHGKGEGVLRKEIEKSLKHQYKNYSFQDASFREYGFGATMVIIH